MTKIYFQIEYSVIDNKGGNNRHQFGQKTKYHKIYKTDNIDDLINFAKSKGIDKIRR